MNILKGMGLIGIGTITGVGIAIVAFTEYMTDRTEKPLPGSEIKFHLGNGKDDLRVITLGRKYRGLPTDNENDSPIRLAVIINEKWLTRTREES